MHKDLHLKSLSPHIAELTISQPQKRNAMRASMWAAFPDILNDLAQDTALRVLILKGQGEHFCAGVDISEFETFYATKESSQKISQDISGAMTALANFPMPTIANIKGACIGGGAALALCCDMRFAAIEAKFAITPARLGLVYPFEDIVRLIANIGLAHAKDMLLSARVINAKRAEAIGLVTQCLDLTELDPYVMDYAQNLSALSAHSTQTLKSMCSAYEKGQRESDPAMENLFLDCFEGDDFKIGYTAFLNKSKPKFK